MAHKLKFIITKEYNNMKAQYYLKGVCGLSSRMITRLKREKGGILMDGEILRTVDLVREGSTVEINMPDETSFIEPVCGSLDIVYEDDSILIINKSPFMPVHPAKQHQTDTLANIVAYYSKAKNENYVFRAVNRIDRDTSGLAMISKDGYCINKLKGNVEKIYYAICHGKITSDGTVNAPIGLCEDSKIVRHIISDGSPAITHYSLILSDDNYSFLKLRLETGRTHQIRCHMASLGHPLAGDDLYGGSRDEINRQALHCAEMTFIHPILQKEMTVKAAIPEDMKGLISQI